MPLYGYIELLAILLSGLKKSREPHYELLGLGLHPHLSISQMRHDLGRYQRLCAGREGLLAPAPPSIGTPAAAMMSRTFSDYIFRSSPTAKRELVAL